MKRVEILKATFGQCLKKKENKNLLMASLIAPIEGRMFECILKLRNNFNIFITYDATILNQMHLYTSLRFLALWSFMKTLRNQINQEGFSLKPINY